MTSFVDDNGNILDYTGDDFTITKQSLSVFSFNLKGDVSINFKIDNNSINRKAIGYYGPQQISSPVLGKITFNLFRNGNLISRGFIVVNNIDAEQMECYFIAGNASWFQDFQFDIREIDFVDDFTKFTGPTSFTTPTTDSGVVFPFVDWAYNRQKMSSFFVSFYLFSNSGSTKDSAPDFFPCFYLKNLVDYAFRKAGYKPSGDLFTDELYLSTIVTPDSGELIYPKTLVDASTVTASIKAQQSIGGGTIIVVRYTRDTGQSWLFNDALFAPVSYILSEYEYTIIINTDVQQSYTLGGTFGAAGPLDSNSTVSITGTGPVFGLRGTQALPLTITGASNFNILTAFLTVKIRPEVRQSWINPSCILPSLKAVDLIKSIAIRFGAKVTYDNVSKVISLDKIDGMQTIEDWSNYLVSYEYRYQEQFKNNYIRTPQPEEFANYDLENKAGYGEGNIQTDFNVNQDRDLYTDPFAGALDSVMPNMLQWSQPYIPLINFSDGDTFTFTSVTDNGGYAQLNGASFNYFQYNIIRIVDQNGFYSGYHCIKDTPSTTTVTLMTSFGGNATGSWYLQNPSFNQAGSRLLTAIPNYSLLNFGAKEFFSVDNITGSNAYSTCTYAYFSKPTTFRGVDQLKQSLSYGRINLNGYNDASIQNRYQKVSNMLNGPLIRCQMLLPESVFSSFNSDKLIFLTCKDFNGTFWVEKILNYKDSKTLVEVDLLFT